MTVTAGSEAELTVIDGLIAEQEAALLERTPASARLFSHRSPASLVRSFAGAARSRGERSLSLRR